MNVSTDRAKPSCCSTQQKQPTKIVFDKIGNVRRSNELVYEHHKGVPGVRVWKIKCQVGGRRKNVRDRKRGVRRCSRSDDDRVQKWYGRRNETP